MAGYLSSAFKFQLSAFPTEVALFPQAGGKPRDLAGTPYRQLVVSPLRIFYRLSGENVVIIHVMRSEQQFRLRDVVERER